jgi:hypothetical protein
MLKSTAPVGLHPLRRIRSLLRKTHSLLHRRDFEKTFSIKRGSKEKKTIAYLTVSKLSPPKTGRK